MATTAHPVVKDKLIPTPSLEYFVRAKAGDAPMLGPVSYIVACACARRFSYDNDSQLAEVYVIVGSRPGDSKQVPDTIKVILLYRSGKLLLSGSLADNYSRTGLPF